MITRNLRGTIRHALQLFVQSEDELGEREALARVGGCVHEWMMEVDNERILSRVDHMIWPQAVADFNLD